MTHPLNEDMNTWEEEFANQMVAWEMMTPPEEKAVQRPGMILDYVQANFTHTATLLATLEGMKWNREEYLRARYTEIYIDTHNETIDTLKALIESEKI